MNVIFIIKEVEYAIKILAALKDGKQLSATEISKQENIPSPFIYRVLKKLESEGILKIKRGAQGGYSVNRDYREMTLYDVISAFENTFLVIECIKPEYNCERNGGNPLSCCMHNQFSELQEVMIEEFNRKSLAELLKP